MSRWKCAHCEDALPYSTSEHWWLYSCGHLICNLHASANCCDYYPYVGDILQDEVVQYSLQYLKYLQHKASDVGGTGAAVVDSVMAIIANKIEAVLAPIRQNANMFQSLETLTIDPTLRMQPWACPKEGCGAVWPPNITTCKCGYVNLRNVDINPPEEEPANPPQPEQPQIHTQTACWKCEKCSYEYNLQDHAKCGKCSFPNPARGSCSLM